MKIELAHVYQTFTSPEGKLLLLQDISVLFQQSHSYAITGVSGAGKSTLLHIIAGLMQPTQGTVISDGHTMKRIGSADREDLLNAKIGLLFETPYLIKELTAIENVMLKGLIAHKEYGACAFEAMQLLAMMELEHKAHEKPPLLSGGQQQRVALARALFGKPAFLLADEPTGDLDPKTGAAIVELFGECQEKWGMGIIVTTHDKYVADKMEYRYVLEDGRLYSE